MKFSRQEYWSELPFPSPGDLSDLGIEPRFLHCRQILYHLSHQRNPGAFYMCLITLIWLYSLTPKDLMVEPVLFTIS